ncbi:P1 family peptidase [Streptomyces sp. TRM 70351]|uniref:P1 family peptidase n=1 Tax=Streptomyces sp. TRM 70351 TaxID=3116552 RepID=UPI002E7B43AF|nr:P1 family peptidase [Streptomyces sp. TRM 70351]MEE1929503.1 P1 family peptidase [Streptomyces sp. TRM 70351]
MTGAARTGHRDALTDVPGVRVGHAQRTGDGWLTGTTVVLAPPGGAVAAVDVRGGGPGTRETDALDPRNVVQRIDAVVLTGGSAFGLDAASGVMAWLEERGRGVRVGAEPGHVVPVVPAACLFDLGRGGDWRARPDAGFGRAAAEDAAERGSRVALGNVGAGTGAVADGLKGGVGTASTVLPSGVTVGALAVVNAAGSVLDPASGALYGELALGRIAVPDGVRHAAARERIAAARAALGVPPLNTTLAVVATDAALSKAQAQKLAGTAHDGLARAVRPVHLLHDGDTVFALSAGEHRVPGLALNDVLAAGADMVTRAVVSAVLAAGTVPAAAGGEFPAYRDLYGR